MYNNFAVISDRKHEAFMFLNQFLPTCNKKFAMIAFSTILNFKILYSIVIMLQKVQKGER